MGALVGISAGGQDPVGAGIEGKVGATIGLTAFAGYPFGSRRHANLIGEGRVVVAHHSACDMGAVAIIVAGSGSPANIRGVMPTGWVGGVGAAPIGLVQGGMVPLHPRIDGGDNNPATLAIQRPKLVGPRVLETPGQGA